MNFRPDLPTLYLITPEPASDAPAALARFLKQLSASLATCGPALVQLRVRSLSTSAYAMLAAAALTRCWAHGARLILNGPITPEDALALGVDGIHLTSAALHTATSRPVPADVLLSVACHTLDDLRQAAVLSADCGTLSPVLPTLSHPGAPTLGWDGFAADAAQTAMPLYALGGMTRADLNKARRHGAHGIAGIRGFWHAGESAV